VSKLSEKTAILAYKLFLGRDPENKEAINYHRNAKDVFELGNTLMHSDEFLSKIGLSPDKSQLRHPNYVEYKANTEQLTLMTSRIKEVWSNYGETEPFWSVITRDAYLKENFEKSQEEFYQSGHDTFKSLMDALARNDIPIENLKTCLEFGCGTGRVTLNLANTFEKVIACDISTPHLRLAEQYIDDNDIHNVSFRNTLGPGDILEMPKVNTIVSTLVLQHNPPPLIAQYISSLLQIVKHGGVVFFQLPTYKRGYHFSVDAYIAHVDDNRIMEMHIIPQKAVFDIVKDCKCIVREVRENNLLGDLESISNTFLIERI